jgi:hypothetical protein
MYGMMRPSQVTKYQGRVEIYIDGYLRDRKRRYLFVSSLSEQAGISTLGHPEVPVYVIFVPGRTGFRAPPGTA